MALPTGLLTKVKNYLDITWTDADTDIKITGIVERGIKYLDIYVGVTLDYTLSEQPQELLFEYCYYVFNGILNEFIIKYTPQMINLKLNYGESE